jgi:MoxR-like ATPase
MHLPSGVNMDAEISRLTTQAKAFSDTLDELRNEMKTVIVGQRDVIDRLLIALCADGHVLLEGVPGIAKTLTIRTLSQCIDCSFVRIQFTPDLLPADIMGTKIYNQKESTFLTVKGPVFAHFVLADEINRAPPKVQSALLEAMQEKQVTIQGETHILARPFFVLATENPIESEGTYPLPEAQVDRFMFKVLMTYPDKKDEVTILDRFTEGITITPRKVISVSEILSIQAFTRKVYADPSIKRYVSELVDATRNPAAYGIDYARYIALGASPRASIFLILGGKAHALLAGRGYVIPEDIKAVAHDVLRHRIILNYEGEADGITTEAIIDRILGVVKVP